MVQVCGSGGIWTPLPDTFIKVTIMALSRSVLAHYHLIVCGLVSSWVWSHFILASAGVPISDI